MCKVSIIMPVYNKEKYVTKAISSVLAQTMKDWELLIIDDGSTDSSFEKCNQFDDKRIKLIRVENGGVSKARNIGLNMACGEYVTFIDSDDYVSSDYLQMLYNSRAEIVIAGLTKVYMSKQPEEVILPEMQGVKAFNEISDLFYKEQILSGIYGFVAGKMIKKNIIEENHFRFDETIKIAEDYDFFLKIYGAVKEIEFMRYTGYFYLQEIGTSGMNYDFFSQIDIQTKTKHFLERQHSFSNADQQLYLNRVTGYVYTILLLNLQISYQEYILLFNKLKEYVPVVSDTIQGIGRVFIYLYDKNRKLPLYVLMKLRKMVKKA